MLKGGLYFDIMINFHISDFYCMDIILVFYMGLIHQVVVGFYVITINTLLMFNLQVKYLHFLGCVFQFFFIYQFDKIVTNII